MRCQLLAGLLCFGTFGGGAAEWQWDWQSGIAVEDTRATTFFADFDNDAQWQSLLSLQLTTGAWRSTGSVQHNQAVDSSEQQSHATLSSLYWQQSLNAQADWELTLGKLQLDWGVGYGYRPLNIFSDYQRHPVGIQVEQGAQVAMLTRFTSDGTWQWLTSRSHHSSLDTSQTQQGLGLRRYWLTDANEWQALVYWDQQRHWLAGASLVTVIGESLELHGSMLYQQQYTRLKLTDLTPGATTVAIQRQTQQHSWQTLLGFTWASSHGVQLIGEYWYDSRSWSKTDWQRAQQQAQFWQQPWQSSSAQRNAGLYAIGYSHTNILQHTVLLHLAANSRFWRQFTTALSPLTMSLDCLYGPSDGSVVLTPRIQYQLLDGRSSLTLSLSWRYYGGQPSAAFANLGQQSVTWFGLSGRF